MKVILLVDVKGHGKKDQILDLPSGYANFLIKNKQAVMANETNLDILAEEQTIAKQKAEELIASMTVLKNTIESKVYDIYVRLGADGFMQGSLTSKMIIEAVEKALPGVKLDKRKLTYDEGLRGLGSFTAKIQLHPEVCATIKFNLTTK